MNPGMMSGMGMMGGGMPMGVVSAPAKIGKDADKVTTVFVGGLRKSTTEDKVAGHFAKYGQAGP